MEFKQNTLTFESKPLNKEVTLPDKSFSYKGINVEFYSNYLRGWHLIIDRESRRSEVSVDICESDKSEDSIGYASSHYSVEEVQRHIQNAQIAIELIGNKTEVIEFLKQAQKSYDSEFKAYETLCEETTSVK